MVYSREAIPGLISMVHIPGLISMVHIPGWCMYRVCYTVVYVPGMLHRWYIPRCTYPGGVYTEVHLPGWCIYGLCHYTLVYKGFWLFILPNSP